MRSPLVIYEDLDAGSEPYGRSVPRRSKPFHTLATARTSTTTVAYQPSSFRTSVPFSWEHLPGIPKAYGQCSAHLTSHPLLPLPPPLRSAPTASLKMMKGPNDLADPFAAALAKCSKGPPGSDIKELFARSGSASGGGRGRSGGGAAWSISDRFGFVGLHASCKASCCVADSNVLLPRSGLNRRFA